MPVYATRTDLYRLGLPEKALGGISTAAQDEALEAASRLADSYLRSRCTLPLTAWGLDLTRAVCVLASWDLLVTRGFDPDGQGDAAIRLRQEDAMSWLSKVSNGTVTPDVTDSTPTRSESAPRVWSMPPRGW